jgi:hypothetical protein
MSNLKPTDPIRPTVTPPEPATDWSVFEKLRLNPKLIRCESYKEFHGQDSTCHTTLRPKVDSIKSHILGDHSGAFYVELEAVPEGAKVWSGWQDLKLLGAELEDLRGAYRIDKRIGAVVHEIRPLMEPHMGNNKRKWPGKAFYMTISLPIVKQIPVDEE